MRLVTDQNTPTTPGIITWQRIQRLESRTLSMFGLMGPDGEWQLTQLSRIAGCSLTVFQMQTLVRSGGESADDVCAANESGPVPHKSYPFNLWRQDTLRASVKQELVVDNSAPAAKSHHQDTGLPQFVRRDREH